jgi:hypothetical protein
MRLKYTLENLRWIKALWSPFKPFSFKWYVGKTQIGTPYFLPRKWVKVTKEDALKMATENTKKKGHIHYDKDPNTLIDNYINYTKPVPLTVGFNYCSLGWKTKWTSDDFRHEWNPVFSFVFFGYQIALTVYSKYHSHYWEPWLYYEYATDKTKSKRERIEQCRKEAPQTWTSHKHGEEPVTTDYYTKILKSKWLKD